MSDDRTPTYIGDLKFDVSEDVTELCERLKKDAATRAKSKRIRTSRPMTDPVYVPPQIDINRRNVEALNGARASIQKDVGELKTMVRVLQGTVAMMRVELQQLRTEVAVARADRGRGSTTE